MAGANIVPCHEERQNVQTPDNECGRETEQIMQAICPWDTKHSTEAYNRCYEAVYALLVDIKQRQSASPKAAEPK